MLFTTHKFLELERLYNHTIHLRCKGEGKKLSTYLTCDPLISYLRYLKILLLIESVWKKYLTMIKNIT